MTIGVMPGTPSDSAGARGAAVTRGGGRTVEIGAIAFARLWRRARPIVPAAIVPIASAPLRRRNRRRSQFIDDAPGFMDVVPGLLAGPAAASRPTARRRAADRRSVVGDVLASAASPVGRRIVARRNLNAAS